MSLGKVFKKSLEVKLLKFIFSKKARKIDKIFTIDLTLCSKSTGKILSIYVVFLENTNFMGQKLLIFDQICPSKTQNII